jgi:hypothetical protein
LFARLPAREADEDLAIVILNSPDRDGCRNFLIEGEGPIFGSSVPLADGKPRNFSDAARVRTQTSPGAAARASIVAERDSLETGRIPDPLRSDGCSPIYGLTIVLRRNIGSRLTNIDKMGRR